MENTSTCGAVYPLMTRRVQLVSHRPLEASFTVREILNLSPLEALLPTCTVIFEADVSVRVSGVEKHGDK